MKKFRRAPRRRCPAEGKRLARLCPAPSSERRFRHKTFRQVAGFFCPPPPHSTTIFALLQRCDNDKQTGSHRAQKGNGKLCVSLYRRFRVCLCVRCSHFCPVHCEQRHCVHFIITGKNKQIDGNTNTALCLLPGCPPSKPLAQLTLSRQTFHSDFIWLNKFKLLHTQCECITLVRARVCNAFNENRSRLQRNE